MNKIQKLKKQILYKDKIIDAGLVFSTGYLFLILFALINEWYVTAMIIIFSFMLDVFVLMFGNIKLVKEVKG